VRNGPKSVTVSDLEMERRAAEGNGRVENVWEGVVNDWYEWEVKRTTIGGVNLN
jgi:hypothetical protein